MRLEPPRWWYERRPPLIAWGLLPISLIYGTAVRARFSSAAPYRSSLPVICIGNFTLGGAGKTPVAIKLANLLRAEGLRPAFLTRGYGGREKGPRLVAANDTTTFVGDEPLLLARSATTVVSAQRPLGAKLLEKLKVDVIVMDDGFQNPSLEKDFSLIVVDGGVGLGSAHVFPLGPLRAPLAFQMEKANAIVVLGAGSAGMKIGARFKGKPIFHAEVVPTSSGKFAAQRVIAFCGIGRPAKFFATLDQAGIDVIKCVKFPDHHFYSQVDAATLLNEAEKAGATLVTTEKDHVRLLGESGALKQLAAAVEPFPITVRFQADGETQLLRLIADVAAMKRLSAVKSS